MLARFATLKVDKVEKTTTGTFETPKDFNDYLLRDIFLLAVRTGVALPLNKVLRALPIPDGPAFPAFAIPAEPLNLSELQF